jgi:hypothetical protein
MMMDEWWMLDVGWHDDPCPDFSSYLLGEQDLSWFLVATPDFRHTQNRVLPNFVVNPT